MANRSKKVVLSARVDPYLKAALEMAASSRNEKIVKLLEAFVGDGLEGITIDRPSFFKTPGIAGKKINLMMLFKSIWTDDEVLFRLRQGILSPALAGEEAHLEAWVVYQQEEFKGDDDVFGNLNGMTERYEFSVAETVTVNLNAVKDQWPLIQQYVRFLLNNKPFEPTYAEFKQMANKAESK
jgi:hypothetical protein